MKNAIVFLCLMVTVIAFPSNAAWMTKTEDDIFTGGQKARMIGEVDNSLIVFECENSKISMSYVELSESKTVDDLSGMAVSLLFKVDSNPLIKTIGILSRRNDKAIQITVVDDQLPLKMLSLIKNASNKINIGVEFVEINYKFSKSGDVRYSTQAVKSFSDACGVNINK